MVVVLFQYGPQCLLYYFCMDLNCCFIIWAWTSMVGFIISVWTSMVVLLFQYGPQWLLYYFSMDLNGCFIFQYGPRWFFIISVWTLMVVLLFQYGPHWLFYYFSMDLNGCFIISVWTSIVVLFFQYGPQWAPWLTARVTRRTQRGRWRCSWSSTAAHGGRHLPKQEQRHARHTTQRQQVNAPHWFLTRIHVLK